MATAVGAFAGTNIDDFVLLLLLFVRLRDQAVPPWRIVAGQFLGFTVLVAVSAAAALGLTFLSNGWVGLLGLIPLALGIRGLLHARGASTELDSVRTTSVLSVLAVTVANGGDNISVYALLFRSIGAPDSVVAVVVFYALLGLWCALAALLCSRTPVSPMVTLGHWLVPAVFVIIGLVIVFRSGLIPQLLGHL